MTNEEMSLKTKQALVDALKTAMKTKKLSKNELLSLNFLRGCAIIGDDETPALAQGR